MLNTNDKKAILVTGGCGFIGSDYLRQFVVKYPQHTFVNIDALTYAGSVMKVAEIADKENYVFVHGDIRDKELVEQLFVEYKFDVVVNFAAESHVDNSISNPGIFLDTNIMGTHVLLEAAKKYGVERFHQISTDEVYGDLPLDQPELLFTEDTPINPSSPYSSSKASADLLCMAYYRTYKLPVTISRCSNNYGEFQDQEKLIPTILRKIKAGEQIPVYGTGENVRDWIYVGEHNLGVEAILENGKVGEVYNLGSRNEWTNLDLVKLILKLTGKDESLISFVEDRKGHDERYAIDYTKCFQELGWKSNYDRSNFEEKLLDCIQFYLDGYDKFDGKAE